MSPERVILPPKPEYPSPNFVFTLTSPELVKQRIEMLADAIDPRQSAALTLGPESDGIIGSLIMNITGLKTIKEDPYYNFVDCSFPILLPIFRVPSEQFIIETPHKKKRFFLTDQEKREVALANDLQQYINPDILFAAKGDWKNPGLNFFQRSKAGNISDAGISIEGFGSTFNEISRNSYFRFSIPKELFRTDTAINQALFEAHIRDAYITAFICTDHAIRYLGIGIPRSSVSVDPDQFKFDLGDISRYSLTPEESSAFMSASIVESFVPPEARTSHGSESIVRPPLKSNKIEILPNGAVIFRSDEGEGPKLRIIK